ncbi:hypothetical protein [Thermosporothrix hazakensis]|uniref:hypothetical protein n=1 Tax=Thermosporothrix hazakensis TaxID=644383 RepID=UPI0010F271AF|nr:hypothetical protein [Thermosporothrix hazakensis]GCE51300.1 hypothetical protein KTH_61690 [Thermosporothrix hazakensis]
MQGRKPTLYELRIRHNIFHHELQHACEARGLRASYLACVSGAAIPREAADIILAALNELAHTHYQLDEVDRALRPPLAEQDLEGKLRRLDELRLEWLHTRRRKALDAYRALERWFENQGLAPAYHDALERHVLV